MRTSFLKVTFLQSKSFDFERFWSGPDPNFFGSCSAPEPDPNGHENQDLDPDPNKVSSDAQHCCVVHL